MGDDDHHHEFSNFEYETRKKKGKRKQKPHPILNISTNLKDFKFKIEENERDISAAESLEDILPYTEEFLSIDGFPFSFPRTTTTSPSLPFVNKLELEEFNEEKYESNETEENFKLYFNENALPKFAPTYELEKFKKNALIIFNQEDIDDEPRHGTHTDVEALRNTFENFGFEVTENIHHDLTKDEIFRKMDEFVNRDFTDYGCIGVAVLTHGSRYGRLRAKDKAYSEMEIINYLKVYNKPSLVTKPKFLIIQACRGTKIKPGVPVLQTATIRTDTDTDLDPYHLPEEADILVLHSCYIGTPSLRHEVNGSWFIQSLCQTIDRLAPNYDLESIITEVKRIVAIDRFQAERKTLPVQMCQMPVLTSTLIRKLYLRKFGDPPPSVPGLVTPLVGVESSPGTRKDSKAIDLSVTTPLLPQFGPCSCFLDHFKYLRDCLRHYLDENPDDTTGKLHLDLADEFEDKVEFNTHKQKMLRIIHDHLQSKAKSFEYFKYLYLCEK